MANQHYHDQIGSKQAEIVMVMVPFTGQGHLNQLLRFSRLISAYSIPIHFVATATHSRQAKLGIHGCDVFSDPNFHFHEFPTPHFICPPPDPNAKIKFPTHTLPSVAASLHLREPVAKLLRALSHTARRLVVIYDILITSVVQDVVSIPNAEAYVFRPLSAFYYYMKILRSSLEIEPEKIPKSALSLEGCFSSEFAEFIKFQESHQTFHSGILYDSSRVVEGKYLDFLTKEESCDKTKHWGLGPFCPVEIHNENDHSGSRHESLEWLDKQDESSVIYVSFGTTTCLSDEQIRELAIGLEESEQKFLWVLRNADRGNVSGGAIEGHELPKGYEERVVGKGMIVRDWVPQLEILGHPSTGGFMSHCGWNSAMESITMGVPVATWPMHSDQPRNAVLIIKELEIGLVAKDWERRDELVTSLMVENVVRRLMASKGGEDIRRRAAKLGCDVRRSVAQGGVSYVEFNNFVAHITR